MKHARFVLVILFLFVLTVPSVSADDSSSNNYQSKTQTFTPGFFDITSNSFQITGSVEPVVNLSQSNAFSLRHGTPLKETTAPAPTPTPTPTPSPGGGSGGGGGGGGGGGVPPVTSVIFSGRGYPSSSVTVLKDAQVTATTIADPQANFIVTLSGLSSGNYIFSLYGEDKKGNRSSLVSFPVSITEGTTTKIQNIFLAPTIDVDRDIVPQGDNIAIFGQSAPAAQVTIVVNSDQTYFAKVPTDAVGVYLYNFDTTPLEIGDHFTKSKSAIQNEVSPFSHAVKFAVSTPGAPVPPPPSGKKCGRADLNCDGRVNLVDFSIAAYWYHRAFSPEFAVIEKDRLNGDGVITLVDFSIMAYYWSG